MSKPGPLHQQIMAAFDSMSPQIKIAASFVLDHPSDVALLSMREQAKHAGLPPSTMTRFAQKLGFDGYDDVRALYGKGLRDGLDGFSDRAGDLVHRHRTRGQAATALDLLEAASRQVEALGSGEAVERIAAAADAIGAARRVFVLGRRSSFPLAFQLAYACDLIGCDGHLLDAAGGIGFDRLANARADDVLVVIGIRPYAAESLTLATYAARRGMPVVAITDSLVSPLATDARHVVIVGVESPSFFHTMVPGLAAVEAMVALVAAKRAAAAQEALEARERHFAGCGALLRLRPSRKGG